MDYYHPSTYAVASIWYKQLKYGLAILSMETEEFIDNWEQLDLPCNLLRGIYAYGFEKPSPIQSRAIAPATQGRDLVAQAQSGTGKTGFFAISCLSRVTPRSNGAQVIILSPTRELAQQSVEVVKAIGQYMKEINIVAAVGGSSVRRNMEEIQRNKPQIIIGTPGRMLDLLNRNCIYANDLKMLIIDEADEMLTPEFKHQLLDIRRHFHGNVQTIMVSATIPVEIEPILDNLLSDPLRISVKTEQLTLEGIDQYYIAIDSDRDKVACVKDLFGKMVLSHSIVYCNSITRVEQLVKEMTDDSFPVCMLHGMMSKEERESSLTSFRNGESRVLVSSNLTARGIDIQQVSTVINFDVPNCVHAYLHRIGRSGRWGRKGVGINFVGGRDVHNIRAIERHYSTEIQEMPNDWSPNK